jgi:hypothetical protein
VKTKVIRQAVSRSELSVAELSKETGLGTARLYELLDEERPEQNITFDSLQRLAVVLSPHLKTDPTDLFKTFFASDLALINKRLKKSKS